jgi:uncharacterized RDD family membrane protein YckC
MILGQTTTLSITTPEGVVFRLPLASPLVRSLGALIDIAVMAAITKVVNVALSPLAVASISWFSFFQTVFSFFAGLLYPIISEWLWQGQTVGKRLFRLRVVDERGLSLTFSQIVIRNLMRVVDLLPMFYVVGGVTALFTRHCQRLGDLAAGTVVVRSQTIDEPDLENILSSQYNSFRDHPLAEARLRQNTSPDAAALALGALLRRDELEPARRLAVFAPLAEYFKELATFPPEVSSLLSDEQYLRNVVDTLYRKTGR